MFCSWYRMTQMFAYFTLETVVAWAAPQLPETKAHVVDANLCEQLNFGDVR